jgi:hypothetical protein
MGFCMSVYSGYCERSLIPRRVLVCVLPLPEPPTRLPLSEAWMPEKQDSPQPIHSSPEHDIPKAEEGDRISRRRADSHSHLPPIAQRASPGGLVTC